MKKVIEKLIYKA